jgi:hypothetical protein
MVPLAEVKRIRTDFDPDIPLLKPDREKILQGMCNLVKILLNSHHRADVLVNYVQIILNHIIRAFIYH